MDKPTDIYDTNRDEERAFRAAFARSKSIGPILFGRLRAYFSSARDAWEHLGEYEKAGIPPAAREYFSQEQKTIHPEEELLFMERSGVSCVIPGDEAFPQSSTEIHDAPYILFYRGVLPSNERPCIAVVGSRKVSSYGKQVIAEIVSGLTKLGITIVSGLAFGGDGESHRVCLNAGGITVAVRGEGIDRQTIGPRYHYQLAEDIVAGGGCVMSEYPPFMPGRAEHFPIRNRIIAALSLGVLVIEAAEKSGALITAKYALEYNREVFAVPGSIFSSVSVGTNTLLKVGAACVTSAQDIVSRFEYLSLSDSDPSDAHLPMDPQEKKICDALVNPCAIDDLVRMCQLDITTLNSTLVRMEINGIVKRMGGMIYPTRSK